MLAVPPPEVVHGNVMVEVIMMREMMAMLMDIVAKEMREMITEKTMTEDVTECSARCAMRAAAAVCRGIGLRQHNRQKTSGGDRWQFS